MRIFHLQVGSLTSTRRRDINVAARTEPYAQKHALPWPTMEREHSKALDYSRKRPRPSKPSKPCRRTPHPSTLGLAPKRSCFSSRGAINAPRPDLVQRGGREYLAFERQR